MNPLCTLPLPDGTLIPRIGQGTWYMGENAKQRAAELKALRWGIENGMTLIDTAEMYGDGLSEKLVGEAISSFGRDELFLVSKVYPWNAGAPEIFSSCDNTLSRMGVDHLDLYLLHWKGHVPLEETVDCMQQLVKQGKILRWGVSNFDLQDMENLLKIPGGSQCAVNQVLYHLGSRGIEFDLLPWMQKKRIPLMAYCPLAQAGTLRRGLVNSPEVLQIAKAHQASPYQVLLAFVLTSPGIFAIPRSSNVLHTQENRAAADLVLSPQELALLDRRFPAPNRPTPLDVV